VGSTPLNPFVTRAPVATAAFCLLVAPAGAFARTPQPHGTPPSGQRSFAPRVPSTPEHTEYVVEVNRKGQVTRIRSGKASRDLAFNTMTYGNALQAYIRTPDGHAVAGSYRLAYDYAPKTKNVHRSVALLHAGGVNPGALGAVDQMTADARKSEAQIGPSPSPLPDFESIEKSH
jgi:hypothetical protein